MAEDDEVLHDGEEGFDPDVSEEEEAEPEDIDPEVLEEELDEDEAFAVLEEDDETFTELEEDDEEDEAEVPAARRPATAPTEDEDEDDDLLAPDDVEADLDTILKDRLVTAEEAADEDDEEAEPDDPRTDPGDRLQPKRADEQLCSSCFLLVRAKAPGCPMADDACPIFAD